MHPQLAAGNLECGASTLCQIPVPTPLATAHGTDENLVAGHDEPDDHCSLRVFLGPDPDFSDIAQFTQSFGIELRYCLAPSLRRCYVSRRFWGYVTGML
jgi:hypothetical protein